MPSVVRGVSQPGLVPRETRYHVRVARKASEKLGAPRHLEVGEFEAGCDRATAEREPVAARHGGLPCPRRYDVLSVLPARDVAA